MGSVIVDIIVKNSADTELAKNGKITEKDVRTVTLTAVVDTGASTLVIDEETFKQLGVSVKETRYINVAGGGKVLGKVTAPVDIHWKDRLASVNAVVMPGGKTLLGVIPLEFMDLIVDPTHEQLVGANGDEALLMAL